MKKIILIILIITSSTILSQKTNPLFQVMSSSSMLERPAQFREMQFALMEEMGNQTVGLNVDALRAKLNEFREKLEKINLNLTVSFTSKEIVINGIWNNTPSKDTLKIESTKSSTLNEILLELEKKMLVFIDTEILQKIPRLFFSSPEFGESVYMGIVEGLEKANYLDGIRNYNADKYSTTIANIITKSVLKHLTEKLKSEGFDLTKLSSKIEDLVKQGSNASQTDPFTMVNQKINDAIKTTADDLKARFKEIINKVDYSIVSALTKLNNHLITGNVGFAVAQGEGNLDGGMNYLFRIGSNFRLGVFYNGQFNTVNDNDNSNDTSETKSLVSLIGIQAKYAADKIELSGLVSKIYGSNSTATFEAGLGIAFRITENFIIGLAGFYSEERPTPISFIKSTTLGVSLRGTMNSSPSLLIGVSGNKLEDGKPVFQISYPIPIMK